MIDQHIWPLILATRCTVIGQRVRTGYGTARSACTISIDLGFTGAANLEAYPEAALRLKRQTHAIPHPGRPKKAGAAAVCLGSDASTFTTGQAMAIDGGYTVQ